MESATTTAPIVHGDTPPPARWRAATSRVVIVALLAAVVAPVAQLASTPSAAASPGRSVTVAAPEPVASGSTTGVIAIDVDGFDPANDLLATVRVGDGGVRVTDIGAVDVTLTGATANGDAEVSFIGDHDDMKSVLSDQVRWEAPANAATSDVHVTVVEAPTGGGNDVLAYPSHPDGLRFYEYVAAADIAWGTAEAAAGDRDLLDDLGVAGGAVSGYLVTLTSPSENAVIADGIDDPNLWIGAASDADGSDPADEEWRWVTGPEAGTVFWVGPGGDPADPCSIDDPDDRQQTDADGEPYYCNWNASEPNSETETRVVTNWLNPNNWDSGQHQGRWNDVGPTADGVSGYVVEYGGLGDTGMIPQAGASTTLTAVDAVVVTADTVERSDVDPGPATAVDVTVTFTEQITDHLGDADEALVTLRLPEDGGELALDPDGRDLALEVGYDWTGREVGVTGTFDDLADVLAGDTAGGLTWTPPPTVGDVELAVSISKLPGDGREVFFHPGTGGYYEYVADEAVTFGAAKAAAESSELFGMQGWLATPVDAEQNDFVAAHTTAENVWIGASDSWLYTPQSWFGAEGRWYWVSGPHKDTEFWRGKADGTTVGGMFASWAPGEPNDHGSGEDFAVTNWRGTAGLWNDLRSDVGDRISGFLVQYDPDRLTDAGVLTTVDGRDTGVLTVLPDTPGPPRDLVATAGVVDDDHRLTLTFAPPADDGGGAVTGYQVSLDPAHGAGGDCDGERCTFTGLRAGTGYLATVSAVNASGAGEGAVSAEVFTAAGDDGVGDGGDGVAAAPGDQFAGVPINATMPADRNGRINIPRGRLSRSAGATESTAVDVKLPVGLGGCLEEDTDVTAEYPDVDVTIYDDGFHAWVSGPEGMVGQALDAGAVVWNPECDPASAEHGPAADDEDGSSNPHDVGVADGDGYHADVAVGGYGGGGSLADALDHSGQDLAAELGIDPSGTAGRSVTLAADAALGFDDAGYDPLGTGVDVEVVDGRILLTGTEADLAAFLDATDGAADRITLGTTEAPVTDLQAWASAAGDDRFDVDVTSGRAEARVWLPDGGGTVTFVTEDPGEPADTPEQAAYEAYAAFKDAVEGSTAGGDVADHLRIEDGVLIVTGPVNRDGGTSDHAAIEAFLAAGVLWEPDGEPGSYRLDVALDGDGGYASTITAPLTLAGPPAAPSDVTAVWDAGELHVTWEPSDPIGEPAATYTVATDPSGATTHATDLTEPSHTLAGGDVHDDGGEVTVTVTAVNVHGDVAAAPFTIPVPRDLGDPGDLGFTVTGDGEAVTVSWDSDHPDLADSDEVHVHLDPAGGDGTCSAPVADGGCTVYGVDPGTDYDVEVVVTDGHGDSAPATLGGVTPLDLELGDGTFGEGDEDAITTPQAATDADDVDLPVTVTFPGTWQADISATVAIDAGAGVLHAPDPADSDVVGSGTHEVTFTGSAADVQADLAALRWAPGPDAGTYTLRFDATDAGGRAASLERELRVYAALSAPTAVSATREGGLAVVEWAEPSHTGAAGVDRYVVEVGADHTCEELTSPLRCEFDGVSTSSQTVTVTAHAGDETAAASTTLASTGGSGGSGGTGGDDPDDGADADVPDAPGEPRDGDGGRLTTGDGSVTVDGEVVEADVTADDTGVTVTGDGFHLRATPADADGTPTADVDGTAMRLRTGGAVLVDAGGFQASSQVHGWLFSAPTYLGAFTVAGDGTLQAASNRIPADVTACGHTLLLEGTTAAGQDVEVAIGVWVEADPYPFTDTAHDAPHGPEVACVASRGIAQGVGDGVYDTTGPVLRAQMATLLANTLGLDTSGASTFDDTRGIAHDGAIAAVVDAGIASGLADGRFGPWSAITRGQMATMLAAAADLDVEVPTDGSYDDLTGGVHDGAIVAVSEAGLANGFGDGRFGPLEPVSREQMATFLVRLDDLLAVGEGG